MYQNITHLNLLWRAREYHKKLEAQVQSLLGFVLSVLGGLIEIIKGMGFNVKGPPREVSRKNDDCDTRARTSGKQYSISLCTILKLFNT